MSFINAMRELAEFAREHHLPMPAITIEFNDAVAPQHMLNKIKDECSRTANRPADVPQVPLHDMSVCGVPIKIVGRVI